MLISPAFENQNICIVFSANNDFFPCLAVMLQSIIENSTENNYYDILILNRDIETNNKKVIDKIIENYTNISIRFIDMNEYTKDLSFYTENRKTLTSEAYYRLFIPWIISLQYKKAIYLDADMITLCDIALIYDIDLADKLIVAVRDYWGICNCYIPGDSMRDYRISIGLEEIDTYIISSTIIFNLEKFRKQYTLDYVTNLAISKKWRQHDQDVINILAKKDIKYISAKWGFVTDYGNNCYLPQTLQDELKVAEQNIGIVHFAAGRKPWIKNYAEFNDEFWKYAFNSPYFCDLLKKVKNDNYRYYIVTQIAPNEVLRIEKDGTYYYKNIKLIDYKNMPLHLISCDIKKEKMYISVKFSTTLLEDQTIEIYADDGNKLINSNKIHVKRNYIKGLSIESDIYAEFIIPVTNEEKIKFCFDVNGYIYYFKDIYFDRYAPFCKQYKNSYYAKDGTILTAKGNILDITKERDIFNLEFKFWRELLGSKDIANKKAAFVRPLIFLLRKFWKKPIWFISDRLSRADDNGEAFFKYISKYHPEIDSYFVISKDCEDYIRLQKYGKVINAYSFKHKILQLLADVVLSSQTDDVFRNPFWGGFKPYMDLLHNNKFVFLQHGIISTDLSSWLCKSKQNFFGFIITTKKEESLVKQESYQYESKNIWLTGLARFDFLENKPMKIITIQPTWRRYLAISQNHETGIWNLKPNFSKSEYVTFYRKLLSDKRLLTKARELGYKIQFKIHPSFLGNENEFANEGISLLGNNVSYRDIYSQSSLIVTDYSSSISDFLYLRKPVIYCQFDKEKFFGGEHMGLESDFDYENDGFGEVEYTLEGTINRIIEYMESDCKLKDKYRNRIEKYFIFTDKNNCQRIYNKIIDNLYD